MLSEYLSNIYKLGNLFHSLQFWKTITRQELTEERIKPTNNNTWRNYLPNRYEALQELGLAVTNDPPHTLPPIKRKQKEKRNCPEGICAWVQSMFWALLTIWHRYLRKITKYKIKYIFSHWFIHLYLDITFYIM